MAVTKFLTRKTRLDTIIKYIMNGEKTEKMMYVSSLNCKPDTAIYEMQDTKKRFDKEDGIISYHLIQSFDGKEVIDDIERITGNLNIGVKPYVVFRDELMRDMERNPHIFKPTEEGKKKVENFRKEQQEMEDEER